MNENFSHTEHVLEKTADSLALSVSEKNNGREKLRTYLASHPLPAVAKKQSRAFLYGYRSVVALLLIVLMGSGAASAAEGSLPGNVLYPIKTRITEPVRAALSLSPQARSQFEIERANRRLSEYAHLATESESIEANEELVHSLQKHVQDAKDAIEDLSKNGEESDALTAATDLHAMLSAHAHVIDQIQTEETKDSFEQALASAISESETLASSSEAALPEATEVEIAEAIDSQEKDTEDLVNEVTKGLGQESSSFDGDDARRAHEELNEAGVLIESAKNAEAEGNLKEALLLYTDANEKLGQLTILIEADAELGVDIIKDEEEKEQE